MLEIEKAFNTRGENVYEFFQRPGIGLYIPLYQREYSWDKDNIEQLLDDISSGVERLAEENSDDEIRFLGTIISVNEKDHTKIEPVDKRGLPPVIEKVIDGQQRLSTICLFATQLYKHISDIEKKFSSSSENLDEVMEICSFWKDKLLDIISLDLKRGTPPRKPKIIRGHDDKWIKDGNLQDAYRSSLSNFLAQFIECIFIEGDCPKPDKKTNVGKNTRQIDKWLSSEIINAHVSQGDNFIPAPEILKGIGQHHIWQYERPSLSDLVMTKAYNNPKDDGYLLSSLVHLFAVSHYLLERCCFTFIQPSNDDWAFDMFQSLNASGTPLTAIETFKPLVVNTAKNDFPYSFKGSEIDKSFGRIEELFTDLNSAAQKSKRTNEFLTSVAIVVDAYKVTSHFSDQRKWLNKVFNSLENKEKRKDYIQFLGNYATFYKEVWTEYSGENNRVIEKISTNNEASLCSLLILYLKKSNHKMAVTVLGTFFSEILEGKDNSIKNFVEVTKAVSAFYTIWRSARGNSGLDNVYRTFFKGESGKGVKVDEHKWLAHNNLDVKKLKNYFCEVLATENLLDKEKWLNKAADHLNYKSRSIVHFLLVLSAHETIADDKAPGLMKVSTPGVSNYLTVEKWKSKGVASIEHIAPQDSQNGNWDKDLYKDSQLFQSIGNLALLPTTVNSSAGNKGWKEKLLYYRHLSEQDPDKLRELKIRAQTEGVTLHEDTIELLKKAEYNDHIRPLVTLGETGAWDATLVAERTRRILDISWDRLHKWLV